jgi:ATP-dependent helicase/nuclease subunit A
VKQSIYRFRLADPKIFRDYAKSWRGKDGQTIPLSENFRSRESLLNFVNSFSSRSCARKSAAWITTTRRN